MEITIVPEDWVPPPPPPPPALSPIHTLRNIELSHGEIEFNRSNLSYEVAVGYGPQKITVTPEAEHFRTLFPNCRERNLPLNIRLKVDSGTLHPECRKQIEPTGCTYSVSILYCFRNLTNEKYNETSF